ncbi:MAG TPA: endolytic transglycosylase MltG [Solirubrobacterales bacterium]|nr:endolytic transglycosylase MltG [Solirubrobacterales bacterium]
MSDDWLSGDPFADPDDPAAREREQRRREREDRRQRKAAKQAPPPAPEQKPEPEPPPKREPEPEAALPPLPPPPRTPEQEFWDEPPEPEPEPEAAPPPPPPPLISEPVFPDEGDPGMAGAARNGHRSGGGRRRPGLLGAIARHPFRVFAVLVALFVLWSAYQLFQPFHGDGSGRVQVNVPKGAGVGEIGDLLDRKGVIDDSTLFQIRVRLAGDSSSLYSGHYTLAHGMSYGAAIDALSTPPVKRTVTVMVPEGYSRPQTAQLVEEDGVPGSYTKATVRSKSLNPARYGGKGAKSLEGFLFPDTFELKPKQPAAHLVQLQLQDFKRRIKRVNMRYAKSKNLTVYDVLTIASMIEREVAAPGQRKLVASVIYNRLHEGMPLGIDSTIRFATGNYTKPLTESELATDSPYNTRTNTGLPPGPINSPGMQAIEAAAHPAKTDYLFYVTTPGACGKLTFAKTEAEFEAAVNKYNSAREAAGGNSPTTCAQAAGE